jgi:hypothetical protein
LHALLLARLRTAGELEWSQAIADSTQVQAKKGAPRRARVGGRKPSRLQAPPPRRRAGIPLAFSVAGGNRNDVTQLIPLLDSVPAVRGLVGRPRRRPDTVIADRGYDHDKYRRLAWERGVKPIIARRHTDHGSGLGRYR